MSSSNPPTDKTPPASDPEKLNPKPEDFNYYTERPLKSDHSWGDMTDEHWSKTRGDRNDEVFEYLRSRGEAPGVESGGATRNHYCMKCDGIIPLSYFQMQPADKVERHCPHCGVKLDNRIHRMFNWVEIDQPHDSDLKAFLVPILVIATICLGGLIWWLS
ncbi:MAG: hypothetical protein ACI8TQ_003005 [Planctomycetota bacterium]|jgi:hypothetical protein